MLTFPVEIKITPERIYHLEFHPTTDKPLIFAADKIGNLGILNVSSSDDDEPDISSYKLHARTISTFFVAPTSAESLYTSSYDATIRCLDLNSGKSVEVFVHPEEDPLSSVCALDDACNTLLYSTLSGEVGRFDTRAPGKTETWQCSDKKIGGMHVLPTNRNFFATASLDRTVKIWDLRNAATPVSEHTSRLSVSAAQWSKTGKLATTSYDDTVKIYNPKLPLVSVKREDVIKLEEGVKRQESVKKEEDTETIDLEPEHVIRHNCQTGRW